MVARSKDGWVYTPGKPMERGVPTVSVISPSTKGASVSKLYDTIVVGAGYAGLVSARNLASKGEFIGIKNGCLGAQCFFCNLFIHEGIVLTKF